MEPRWLFESLAVCNDLRNAERLGGSPQAFLRAFVRDVPLADLLSILRAIPVCERHPPLAGQIWLTRPHPDTGRAFALLLLGRKGTLHSGVVVSDETWTAASGDYLLRAESCPFGRDAVVYVWSQVLVRERMLWKHAGALPSNELETVMRLVVRQVAAGHDRGLDADSPLALVRDALAEAARGAIRFKSRRRASQDR